MRELLDQRLSNNGLTRVFRDPRQSRNGLGRVFLNPGRSYNELIRVSLDPGQSKGTERSLLLASFFVEYPLRTTIASNTKDTLTVRKEQETSI